MIEYRNEYIVNKEEDKKSGALVSIVIITFNSAKFVLETLESTKAQTYSNIELIIADDCSTDNTVDVCKDWITKNEQRYVRTQIIISDTNTGTCANVNRGFKAARGEWIKGIAGDDMLTKDCISTCMGFVISRRNENIQLMHGSSKWYNDNFNENNFLRKWGTPDWIFNRNNTSVQEQFNILLRACPISAPTTFFKKSVFEENGYFDENFPLWEDWPMWLKLTKSGLRFYFVDADLALYRVHSLSVQKAQNSDYFSKYLILHDIGYCRVILPNLPVYERIANWYLIFIRKTIVQVGLNKNTRVTHYIYRGLTYFVQNWINKLKSPYYN